MPTEVLMPALSPTMEKGNLAKWLKKEGDAVKSGDVIAEIETDKATMEVEAVDEGTLGKILVPEGTADVAVNTPIAVILAEGEDKSAIKAAEGAAEESRGARAAAEGGRVRAAGEIRQGRRWRKAGAEEGRQGAAAARNQSRRPIPTCPTAPRWSP